MRARAVDTPGARWGVRQVLSLYRFTKVIIRIDTKEIAEGFKPKIGKAAVERDSRSFVICRYEMIRLITTEKSAHDALIIGLPTLMGFRAKEVTTWRLEWSDPANERTLVFDAKKHRFFPLHLNHWIAKRLEEVRHGRSEGYVIENESSAWRGRNKPLRTESLWHVWKKHAQRLNLFPSWMDYSPLIGRQFYAAFWYHYLRLPLVTLSKNMRHRDAKITLDYVERLVFFEDQVADSTMYQNGMEREMEKVVIESMMPKMNPMEVKNE